MTDDDAAGLRGPATRPPEPTGTNAGTTPPTGTEAAPVTEAGTASGYDEGPMSMYTAPTTAGGMIRAAREAQGIDLGSLAAMLKIPMKKLEALEDDRHDELPGATFERALAQAACRALHIDTGPVLALLPHGRDTLERVTGGLNAPFRERQGARVDLGEASSLLRPVVLLPAVLLLAALALFFLPTSLWHRVSRQAAEVVSDASSAASAPTAGIPGPAPGLSVTPVDLSAGSSATPAEAASAPSSTSSPVTVTPLPATGATTTSTTPAPAPVPTPAPAMPATVAPAPAPGASAALPAAVVPAAATARAPVVVTATQQSWVEATDAQGRTLLSRTVVAGESVGIDGAMPIKLRIGNARGTTVTLRGENVDLTPWVRDNIARLQLK